MFVTRTNYLIVAKDCFFNTCPFKPGWYDITIPMSILICDHWPTNRLTDWPWPASSIVALATTNCPPLVWQLMRAYTLALLSRLNPDGTPIVESEILAWANKRLKEEEKEEVEIRSFQDKSIKTAVPILRLVDAIKPGAVNWSIVIKGETLSNEVGDIDLPEISYQSQPVRNVSRMPNIVSVLRERLALRCTPCRRTFLR